MNIIKLSAIDSTNSYLKELVATKSIENYTVVVAEHQTSGRGQMGTVWESMDGKNLTFSVLIQFLEFKIEHQFYLSMAVSLGVLKALKVYINAGLYVKWPNDILAEKDKLSGILIENVLSGHSIKHAIIGIGLNVNQVQFSESLENVTSLKKIMGYNFNKETLLENIVKSIQYFVGFIERKEFSILKKRYINSLYKFNIPAVFEDYLSNKFMGKIIDISQSGELVIEFENEKTRKFNLKEIKFASR